MSDTTERGGNLIDLQPRIRARQASKCEHEHIEVSLIEAELDCADCGAPIDPWWYLRMLVKDDADRRGYHEEFQRIVETHEREAKARLAHLNDEIIRVTAELNRLRTARDDLWAEQAPDGRPISSVGRRRPNG